MILGPFKKSSLLLVLILAGCAGAQKVGRDAVVYTDGVRQEVAKNDTVTANVEGSDVVCRSEGITGSHRKHVVCMTKEEIKAMREAADANSRTRRSVFKNEYDKIQKPSPLTSKRQHM